MTATAARPHATPTTARTLVVGAVAVTGTALLAARPALVGATPVPVTVLAVLFVGVLAAGVGLPVPAAPPRPAAARPGPRATALVTLAGVAAFAVGRWLVGGHPPTTGTGFLVVTSTLAAVAEEAWFRRLWFGLLAPAGDGLAIVGSTLLFAAVHVSIYGVWVLPLDLAAGLLLGWQRSATGSWVAPAITHVAANLLVVL